MVASAADSADPGPDTQSKPGSAAQTRDLRGSTFTLVARYQLPMFTVNPVEIRTPLSNGAPFKSLSQECR